MTIQTVLAEVGPDLSAWKTAARWCSWLNLAPKRDISGGKVIRHRRKYHTNRVGNAFRMAAQSLVRSQSYLGPGIDTFAPSWGDSERSRPWPASWPAYTIGWLPTGRFGSTVAPWNLSSAASNATSPACSAKPAASACNWCPQPESERSTPQRRGQPNPPGTERENC